MYITLNETLLYDNVNRDLRLRNGRYFVLIRRVKKSTLHALVLRIGTNAAFQMDNNIFRAEQCQPVYTDMILMVRRKIRKDNERHTDRN